MSSMLLYFIIMADNFSKALATVALISGLITIIFGVAILIECDFKPPNQLKHFLIKAKWSMIIAVISGFMYVVTPNSKQLATLYLVPKIANSEKMQEIGQDSVDLLHGYIKQQLDSMSNKKEN